MEADEMKAEELAKIWKAMCDKHGKTEASRLWMALFAGKDTPET